MSFSMLIVLPNKSIAKNIIGFLDPESITAAMKGSFMAAWVRIALALEEISLGTVGVGKEGLAQF